MIDAAKLAQVDAAAADRVYRFPDWEGDTELMPGPEVQLIQASQLKILPIRWLWPGWLARGKFHVLAGAPGTGKTTIAMAVAATCTINGTFPDGTPCHGGNVIIWTGEDDPADTLAPRLLASGADLSRVYFIEGTKEKGVVRSFDPARDLNTLMAQAQAIGNIALLIVDPVVSAVAGDGHKAGDVRKGLQPLVDLAAALDCVALGITHFSKGTAGRDPLERVTGSQAFGALARVVIVAAKDTATDGDDTPARRFIARAKSNIGPDGGGFDYSLEQSELKGHPGLIASYVTWGSAIEGTARDLLGAADVNDDEEKTDRDDAVDFLVSLLTDGPLSVKAIKTEAVGAGYAWRTIERAKKQAGIKAQKDGTRGSWAWAIGAEPPKAAKGRHNIDTLNGGGLGGLGSETGQESAAADDVEVF
jgi:putative DNA primase/helicase